MMAAQTLETIPEETVTPAATPERATFDVPKTKPATAKNPGRVAFGKRLAERNRLEREAKKTSQSTDILYVQIQLQIRQNNRQNNQATTATTQATLFLVLVV